MLTARTLVEGVRMQSEAPSDSLETLRQVGRSWGWVLFFGVVTLAVGIVITFRPGGTVRVVAILFGIWLLLLGVFWLVAAIAEHGDRAGTRFGMAFFGLLSVLVGLLVLHHSFETVAVVGFIVGVFWVVGGLSLVIGGLSPEAEGRRTAPIVVGAIFAATGIVCLIYPGLSLTILAVILGIGLIASGLAEIIIAFRVRQLTKV
jgi:uncharacterized membrane protein HdeD (DUF308 family)